MVCCFPLPAIAEIYKQVDTAGQVSYTDSPSSEATSSSAWHDNLPTPKTPTLSTAATDSAPPPDKSATPAAADQKAIAYVVEIMSPQAGATLTNESQSLEVSVSLTPALAAKDKIALVVDGQETPPQTTLQFTLPWQPRGDHTIQAKVLSSDGKSAAESPPITIYQQRPSILLPPQ